MKKFEAASALVVADILSDPRLPGTIGARRAEASIARMLRGHGLNVVERYAGAVGAADLIAVSLILFGLVVSLQLLAATAFPAMPSWVRLVAPWGVFVAALVAMPVWQHARGTAAKIPIVVATMPETADPVARLIVVAQLVTPRGRVFAVGQQIALFLTLSLGFLTLVPSVRATMQSGPASAWALVVMQWGSLGLACLLGPNRWTCRPTHGDNRTGLGMIVELARTWPRSLCERIETVFVVTPGPYGPRQQPPPEAKPTLVLRLDAPGVGRELSIVGEGEAGALVLKAARDLWLPLRRASWLADSSRLRAHPRAGYDVVALCGRRDDLPIEAATIGGVAQLVTEVALRWAKRADAVQGASRPKSSQNPG